MIQNVRYVGSIYVDFSADNVGASYTAIAANPPAFEANAISFSNTGGPVMIGIGVSGQEEDAGILPQIDSMHMLPFLFSPGDGTSTSPTIYAKSVDGNTISTGKLCINFYRS